MIGPWPEIPYSVGLHRTSTYMRPGVAEFKEMPSECERWDESSDCHWEPDSRGVLVSELQDVDDPELSESDLHNLLVKYIYNIQ